MSKTVVIVAVDTDTIEWAERRLAQVEAKRAAVKTEIDRLYYDLCAAGWKRHIEKLKQEADEVQPSTLT